MSLRELLQDNNFDVYADNVIVDGSSITTDLTTLEAEVDTKLNIDFSNTPQTTPTTQEINVVKAPGVTSFGLQGVNYMSVEQVFQNTTVNNNLTLGIGAGADRNVKLEIGQVNSCVRIGPWAERNTLIFSNDALPIASKHQSIGIGSLTFNDMNFQVRNSGAPFTFAHGTAPTTSQNRMILTNTSLSFAGGNYSILDPDGNITIGTDNTTVNNSVIIPSQSNTLMHNNSVGLSVTAATARLFSAPGATTAFSTGFNNIPGQYSCRYNGQKSRTFIVHIDFSYTHSVAASNVTIFASKNGSLTQVTHSSQSTYGILGSISNLKLTEQVTLNNTDTIQIGVLSSQSGTLTAVFSSISCTALLAV